MKVNRLQLNPAKTEVLWCASSRRQHQIPNGPVRVGDALVSPVTAARDLDGPTSKSVPFNRPRPTNKTVADDPISQIRR